MSRERKLALCGISLAKPPASSPSSSSSKETIGPSPAQYLKECFQEWDIPVQPSRDQPYFLKATPDRIQAYQRDLLATVRNQDLDALKERHSNGTLQHNACNAFGESLLHLASRKGMTSVVQFLVTEANMSPYVHDDYGRTIWHDACWTVQPQWPLMEYLVRTCPVLLTLSDVRGHIPADYIPKSEWNKWLSFWEEHRDELKEQLLFSIKGMHQKMNNKDATAENDRDCENNDDTMMMEHEVKVMTMGASAAPSSAAARAAIAAQEQLRLQMQQQQHQQQQEGTTTTTMHVIPEEQDGQTSSERRMSITTTSLPLSPSTISKEEETKTLPATATMMVAAVVAAVATPTDKIIG